MLQILEASSLDNFCDVQRYQKINKCRRAVYCEADDGCDSGFKGYYTFQMSRSFITEFVEVSFDATSSFSVLK